MIGLALAYLRDRGLITTFNILLIALGVASLAVLLLVSSQVERRFSRDSAGIDLVVGAKGSPLQLILSSVYHVDVPTGNVPAASLTLLRGDPGVARAIPLALGDSFRGARIVGTEPAFLDIHGAQVTQGRVFAKTGDVTVGAEAARQTGLTIGRRFAGTHGTGADGHAHDHFAFTVVGILAPTGTVTDRLILTTVDSVWAMHGIEGPDDKAHAQDQADDAHSPAHDHDGDAHSHAHDHDEEAAEPAAAVLDPRNGPAPDITAILVTYRNAMAAVRLPSAINRETALQAASPATETARLLGLFGAAFDGARLFAWLVALTGLASVFVILLAAATAREGDMALLRVMGASRTQAAGTVLLEGLIIAGAGALLGLAAAHALLALGASLFPTLRAVGVGPGLVHPGELGIAAAVLGLGVLAALIPAARVYRTDLADTLARAT
jgi:putative ABC transport system permease protein